MYLECVINMDVIVHTTAIATYKRPCAFNPNLFTSQFILSLLYTICQFNATCSWIIFWCKKYLQPQWVIFPNPTHFLPNVI